METDPCPAAGLLFKKNYIHFQYNITTFIPTSHTLYSTLIRFFLEVFLLAQSVLVVHTEQIVLAVPRLCFETWWKTSESLLATWNGRLQPLETFCSRMDQRSQYGSFSMGSAGSSSDSSTDSYVQNRLRLCFYRTG